MSGRVGVVYGRIAVGKKSFATVRCAWSGNLGDRDDRSDLIGGGHLPSNNQTSMNDQVSSLRQFEPRHEKTCLRG